MLPGVMLISILISRDGSMWARTVAGKKVETRIVDNSVIPRFLFCAAGFLALSK